MVERLHAGHYSRATRYAASAFMRAKLGGALSTRQATAAVFESRGRRWRFWVGESSGSFGPIAATRIGRANDRFAAGAGTGHRLLPGSSITTFDLPVSRRSWRSTTDPRAEADCIGKAGFSVRETCRLDLTQKSGHVYWLNLRRKLLFRYRWYAKCDLKHSNNISH